MEQHQVPISRLLSAPGDCGPRSTTSDDRNGGICNSADRFTAESKFKDKPFVRGKNAKIRYFGRSHMSTLMTQFDGLRCFMREAAPLNPTLSQFRKDFNVWKEHIRAEEEQEEFPCLPNLLECMPPSSEADELVRVYMKMFESTHRILHIPSFWQEYREFWRDTAKASSAFVAQLLLIMACGMLLHHNSGEAADPTLPMANAQTTPRQTAVQWVHAVERWLCHRQRPDITLIRIHCLLIIAKRVNAIELHALWISVGTLVRLAMTMGLHRDPDSLWKVSVFHAEMRRRLWATILELDLQAAMERGMPIREGNYHDCRPPLNLNDWDIMESTEVPPDPRPSNCTETSFQIVLLRSLPVRMEIARLVNSLDANPPYEEILRLDKEITQYLQDIPHNLKIETTSKVHIEAGLSLPKQLLDLYLRRFLLLLHSPFAAQGKDPRYSYSRHVCLENATMLLSNSKQFQDTTVLRALYFKDEHMQAALTICLDLFINKPNPGLALSRDMLHIYRDSSFALVEGALQLLESRVRILGTVIREYFFLSMVLAFVKAKESPELSERYMKQAADRCIRVYQGFPNQEFVNPSPSTLAADERPPSDPALLDFIAEYDGLDFSTDDMDFGLMALWDADYQAWAT
ncbi:hypothetical protein BZA05DRAFT_402146 [Tricharina praecox]|uniref:uncharacterized protein n=1 Tax=Tricharina praecox TaxID=43433 RepID=UPI00221F51E4|nr:uncharacterized protein BZA05DRAFT_402146 [Tricharina praecox]KAI5849077.1 hypothetical protein BZA05DRAFT_402146 [Tricharina praecox]